MIRRKMQYIQETDKKLPLSIDGFIQKLDKGPLPELYNAIYQTVKDNAKKNDYGVVLQAQNWQQQKFGLLLVTGNR